jgi:hypothetical protein
MFMLAIVATVIFAASPKPWMTGLFSHDIFPDSYSVFRTDRDNLHSNAIRGGGTNSKLQIIFGVKQRSDLEVTNKRVWIEIPVTNNLI